MLNSHPPKILCTWEMGGHLGHITRLADITECLNRNGYTTQVALKDLSKAHNLFKHSPTELLQAPLWLPNITMQRPIVCLADVLLLTGYLSADELMGPVRAWKTLLNRIQPDLILFDYSPTAMLAAAHLDIPKIMIGTGFSEPVAGLPMADWRPFPTQDDLVAKQEARVLEVVNEVLVNTHSTPLEHLTDLFAADRMILTVTPDFDVYNAARTNVRCHVLKSQPAQSKPAHFGPAPGPKILAYLKQNHPGQDAIIKALANHPANVFVASPNGNAAQFKPYESDSFRFSTDVVALEPSMAEADLFIGHGNSASTMESLLNGLPCVVLPIQLEQLLIGLKVEELGVGVLIKKVESEQQLKMQLDQAIESTVLREKAKEYANRHRSLSEGTLGDLLVRECGELLNRS